MSMVMLSMFQESITALNVGYADGEMYCAADEKQQGTLGSTRH